jgi:hypothetical protein
MNSAKNPPESVTSLWGKSFPAVSDYHIQKSRCRIGVKTQSGATVTGDMFLQPYGRHGGGSERPMDVLNAAENFFPLVSASGETTLMAKHHVLTVSSDSFDEPDDPRATATRAVAVEMKLINGETVQGTVRLEVPPDHPRLLDFLNLGRVRFLSLDTPAGQLHVNRNAIERVRAVD